MITSLEKATNTRRKIRKVGNEALPDLLVVGADRRGGSSRLNSAIGALEQKLCKTIAKGCPRVLSAAVVEKAGRSRVSVKPVAKEEEPALDNDEKKRVKAGLKSAKKKAKAKSKQVTQHLRWPMNPPNRQERD
jgi:hypothetical protein